LETAKLGKKIGSDVTKTIQHSGGRKTCNIFALSGPLGSGKTTFTQGFAKGLGIKERVVSPTFILMRSYVQDFENLFTFYHLDLYRLENKVDLQLKDLGIEEIWSDPKNIVLIEWAQKATIIPSNACWIKFESLNDGKRKITIPDNLFL